MSNVLNFKFSWWVTGELANEHVVSVTKFTIIYFWTTKTVNSSLTANSELFF